MTTALIVIDFINEIVHEKGKLSGKGYLKFIKENNTFGNLNKLINYSRKNNYLIIFVKVGFSSTYKEQSKQSPLFGKADEFQILKLGTWATEFHKSIDFKEDDLVIIKHRISSFYSTKLDLILKVNNIEEILVAGVSTNLAVSSIVREGHDRDYKMTIVKDCCAAANKKDHENSLDILQKLSRIKSSKDFV